MLCGHAAVDGVDAQVDPRLNTLLAVGAPDQRVVAHPDSAFGEQLRELDGIRAAAGDHPFVVIPVGGDDRGPFDRCDRLRDRLDGCSGIVTAYLTESTDDRRLTRRTGF